jgi:hypothetical protein
MVSRSQWPRGLKHKMSSPAQILGSLVRMPLESWMSVCVYSVFVLGIGLATVWSPVQGVLPTVLDQETERVNLSVSRTPYVPSGNNRNKNRRRKRRRIWRGYSYYVALDYAVLFQPPVTSLLRSTHFLLISKLRNTGNHALPLNWGTSFVRTN